MTLALAARPGREGACRLLALVGPPGSAKSTMVRLLAQDMSVDLAEWQVTPGKEGTSGCFVRCSVDVGQGAGAGGGAKAEGGGGCTSGRALAFCIVFCGGGCLNFFSVSLLNGLAEACGVLLCTLLFFFGAKRQQISVQPVKKSSPGGPSVVVGTSILSHPCQLQWRKKHNPCNLRSLTSLRTRPARGAPRIDRSRTAPPSSESAPATSWAAATRAPSTRSRSS